MKADLKPLLDTLIERWQEVADAYKTDPPRDDNDRTYSDYRHIYLRNIRDLKHVLETGQIPCSLMSDEERGRGDCGRIHDDAHDKHGQPLPEPEAVEDPWAPISPAEYRLGAIERVIVGHLAEALLDSRSEEVRSWARGIAHELRRAGVGLHEAIGTRLTEMALGRLDEEHPF
ncbi:hypothetical protein M2155_000662 [Streptomyces sp. SAI-119]|uniref:hypothetical protein n=1 Tax=Streptomyces sp. SAI-119 TaxID=2940541 RepID=UPI0024766DFF|nr:hypothetical protein [Streptomyces sp. SAI-119]MDH6448254.1 hypothetical protein [Streptomyces sp. SAI-119]